VRGQSAFPTEQLALKATALQRNGSWQVKACTHVALARYVSGYRCRSICLTDYLHGAMSALHAALSCNVDILTSLSSDCERALSRTPVCGQIFYLKLP